MDTDTHPPDPALELLLRRRYEYYKKLVDDAAFQEFIQQGWFEEVRDIERDRMKTLPPERLAEQRGRWLLAEELKDHIAAEIARYEKEQAARAAEAARKPGGQGDQNE